MPNGGKVTITFDVRNTTRRAQAVMLDMRVHFIKANGKASPKVFKLKTASLAGGEADTFRKTISLANLTTRKHYNGRHMVDVLVNGRITPLGSFVVT